MADEMNETPAEQPEVPVAEAPAPEAADAPAPAPEAVAAPAPAPQAYAAPAPAYGGPGAGGPNTGPPMRPRGPRRFQRRKVCHFCVEKLDYVDYKDAKLLRRFVSDRGKILPRRITGTCAAHQRMLTVAAKRARIIALVPFKGE